MRTVLDEARMWRLQAAIYQEELQLMLAEMFISDVSEDLKVGEHVIKDTRSIEVRDHSRVMVVRFSQVIAWQVVDESYTSWDDYEQRDDKGVLQTLSRSKYLDYVHETHGWFRDVAGPAKHFRICTADEVVDVVAHKEPTIEPHDPTSRTIR